MAGQHDCNRVVVLERCGVSRERADKPRRREEDLDGVPLPSVIAHSGLAANFDLGAIKHAGGLTHVKLVVETRPMAYGATPSDPVGHDALGTARFRLAGELLGLQKRSSDRPRHRARSHESALRRPLCEEREVALVPVYFNLVE